MDSYVVCRVVALCTMLILFLPVSAAQIDPTGDNICRDPITRGYRCCDGFYPQGSLCVECDDNWYGPECALTCQCYNGAACHHVTGRCSCSGFWGGPHCTECKRQLYSSYCHPRCMHCFNALECNPVNKDCQCAPGFTGEFCDEPCLDDTFGNDCRNVCNPGWQGRDCNEPCNDGYYGEQCQDKCPECQYGQCDHIRGCVCQPGYSGDRCSLLCPVGYYGSNCMYRCACKNGGICDPLSGNCTCVSHYSGDNCEHEGYYAPPSNVRSASSSGLKVTVYVLVSAVCIALAFIMVLYRTQIKHRIFRILSHLFPVRDEEKVEYEGLAMRSHNVKEYHDVINDEDDEFDEPGEFTKFKVND